MSLPTYSQYKDSEVEWLGPVPAHWAVQRFDAHTVTHRESVSPEALTDLDVLHYSIPSVQETGTGSIEEGSSIDSNKLVVTTAQLLVSKLNPHKQVVVSALPHGELLTVASTEFVPLVPRKANLSYINYVWGSPICLNYLLARCDSATRSHQRVSPDDIAKMKWAWPTPREQAAIAAFLDHETGKIDTLIAEQEKLLTLLAEKHRVTISHVVTRGLNPSAPMKDSGVAWLGEVPANWRVCPIKHLARIGNGSTPNRDNPDYWAEEGYPWLNSSVANLDEVTRADQFVTHLALDECHLPIIEPPAVLVGITGQGKTRGMATKLMFEATVNQHLAYIKPNERELTVPFLLRVLEKAYGHLRTESDGAGSTKGAITCEQLGRLAIPLPDTQEQNSIAAFLDAETTKLEALKAEAERAIELLKERRSALIAAAVTGKIDVRDAVPQELAA